MYHRGVFITDPSDKYDPVKWDFPETMNIWYIEGDPYPYKTRNLKNAKTLSKYRKHIDKVCKRIQKNKNQISAPTDEYLDGVDIFIGLHLEQIYDPYTLPEPFFNIAMDGIPTSRYLLSEIPNDTGFDGLNKPKMRHEDQSAKKVGKDKKGRALYRDIFLNMGSRELDSLVIHELAHSMANHINFRPDDHHEDFRWCERLIKKYW